MSTETQTPDVKPHVPTPAHGEPKDNLAHIMCCDDPDRAMCGGALTGKVLSERDPSRSCLVCEDLWNLGTYCPKSLACSWGKVPT